MTLGALPIIYRDERCLASLMFEMTRGALADPSIRVFVPMMVRPTVARLAFLAADIPAR
jgi:hypothetical protein